MSDPRPNFQQASPAVFQAMLALEEQSRQSTIPATIRQLVKIRVSQINGCAYCLNMHSPEARHAGVSQQQLDVLAAWRESPAFDARERAALGWAEALTRIEATGAPDADYTAIAAQFDEREQVELSLIIVATNGWNRLVVGFRSTHELRQKENAA
ncbi:carboxymuconolactone decarboxylase family protein [Paracoccus caeni]|uniref:Carboxymuconolactone decarboxylase family protein n=1 Tax=Paracoccus caeni TaxID=657651 RepID=A0A934W0I7_9RHOB|nr:carboxymuconolactone decarboxylase family protein [Paracoccus caeni]MBK4218132.1 carboxymuconolactone decarboxylase family protein [Paracoccus caeni]